MYWKVEMGCRGRMCSIVLTLVPFFCLGSSTLLFVIQIIPGREKKNLQIDVENTGTFAFGCKRAGGEMLAPSAASEGSCLFVHVFASFNALFLKSSR